MPDDVVKRELPAAIEARRELGEDMEPAVIDAFVARIEARLADRSGDDARALKSKRDHQKEMVLGSMTDDVRIANRRLDATGNQALIGMARLRRCSRSSRSSST